MKQLHSIIESLLFLSGEPMSFKKLAQITEKPAKEIREAVLNLKNELEENNCGLRILIKEEECQLASAPENSEFSQKLMQNFFNEELSKSALEVLAIVAYRGPIARSGIDHIRGVDSSYVLRNLLLRGLVERVDNPTDSRSYLYKITFDFLKHLGISNIEELPKFSGLNEKIDELNNNV